MHEFTFLARTPASTVVGRKTASRSNPGGRFFSVRLTRCSGQKHQRHEPPAGLRYTACNQSAHAAQGDAVTRIVGYGGRIQGALTAGVSLSMVKTTR